MREILFRGKRADNGEWIEGMLLKCTLAAGTAYLIFADSFATDLLGNVYSLDHAMVDPETVGQFTGLLDKNGRKIFEGDILSNPDYPNVTTGAIYYGSCNCSCCDGVYGFYSKEYADLRQADTLVVIGNIHDNPELLGGDEDGIS